VILPLVCKYIFTVSDFDWAGEAAWTRSSVSLVEELPAFGNTSRNCSDDTIEEEGEP
jgi:hypothetical protein